MIIYCNRSNNNKKYIGGELYDFYDEIANYYGTDLYEDKLF